MHASLPDNAHLISLRGFLAIEADLKHGFDVLKLKNQKMLRAAVIQNVFAAVHFGTPCSSFSRARERGGQGPPPLRSDSYPDGLPGLKLHDLLKVQVGNAEMVSSAIG